MSARTKGVYDLTRKGAPTGKWNVVVLGVDGVVHSCGFVWEERRGEWAAEFPRSDGAPLRSWNFPTRRYAAAVLYEEWLAHGSSQAVVAAIRDGAL